MVPQGGRNRASLSEQLFEEPYRFEFFQAVRLLERTARQQARSGETPLRLPVGEDARPEDEALRFRAMPSLAFPTGEISEVHRAPGEGALWEMVVTFMGLVGPNGVLPQHYTAMVISRLRNKDHALRDFLDLFHHREISLFYRAWEKYRFAFGYEKRRLAGEESDDLFTRCLYSLVGMGTGGLRARQEFDDEALLYYGGLFAHYPRSAISLEILLADYFRLPVAIRQFQGQWLYLNADDLSLLPSPRSSKASNNGLGVNLVVGERVWDVEGSFRVRVGPLSYAEFRRLLPDGETLRVVGQMVRSYVGPQFEFDVQLVLKKREVPWCRLGHHADPARLGWNTWVRSGDFQQDVDDAIFSVKG